MMTLKCPTCAAVVDVSDAAINKLMSCPKCQSKFVANESHRVGASTKPALAGAARPPVDDGYQLDAATAGAKSAPPPHTQWKACPNCGAPWTEGSDNCHKCHFDARVNRVIKPDRFGGISFQVDYQKVYLWLGLAVAAFGVYWLLMNWPKIRLWINSLWPKY